MKAARYAIVLSLLLFVGCAYNVKLDPDIDPTADIANPIHLRTGLFIPDEIKTLTISDRIEGDTYAFNIGEALESMIIKSTNRVFTYVDVLDTHPARNTINENNLDLVVIAKVTSAEVSLNKDVDFFQDIAKGSAQISMQMIFHEDEMLQLTAVMASGMGVGSEKIGMFSNGSREYSAAVESALRNLADDLIHQLHGNYDIRKKAESKPIAMISSRNINYEKSALNELETLLREKPSEAEYIFTTEVLNNPDRRVTESGLDSLGYYLIKQNRIDDAHTVFHINVMLQG